MSKFEGPLNALLVQSLTLYMRKLDLQKVCNLSRESRPVLSQAIMYNVTSAETSPPQRGLSCQSLDSTCPASFPFLTTGIWLCYLFCLSEPLEWKLQENRHLLVLALLSWSEPQYVISKYFTDLINSVLKVSDPYSKFNLFFHWSSL